MPETHRGRRRWGLWHGTPSRIAAIARAAQTRVSGDVAIRLDAARWSSDYGSIPEFEEGIRTTDLPEVRVIEIEATTALSNRRVLVALRRYSSTGSSSNSSGETSAAYASLFVEDDDRAWVEETTDSLATVVAEGSPSRRIVPLLSVGGVIGVIAGSITWGSTGMPMRAIGIATTVLGALMLASGLVASSMIPYFELLPDGGIPRRRQLAGRMREAGAFVARESLAGAIGFGLGVVALLVWQRLFA